MSIGEKALDIGKAFVAAGAIVCIAGAAAVTVAAVAVAGAAYVGLSVAAAVGGLAFTFLAPGAIAGSVFPSHPVIAGLVVGAVWGGIAIKVNDERFNGLAMGACGLTNAAAGYFHEPIAIAAIGALTAGVAIASSTLLHTDAAAVATTCPTVHSTLAETYATTCPTTVAVGGIVTTATAPVRNKLASAVRSARDSVSAFVYS